MPAFNINIPDPSGIPVSYILLNLIASEIPDLSATYLTVATAATTYLKLDCTNDPLTGVLHCDDKIEYTDTAEYIDQETW